MSSSTAPKSSQPEPSGGNRASGAPKPKPKPSVIEAKRKLGCRPLSDLEDNSLYILTFSRGSIIAGDHHWGLYLHENVDDFGTKYHLKGGAGTWEPEYTRTENATTSTFLLGLIRIADIPVERRAEVDSIIKEDDAILNKIEGLRCRSWVGRVCERLKAKGIMNFNSWDLLNQEVLAFGDANVEACEEGRQPRALGFSSVCGLTH